LRQVDELKFLEKESALLSSSTLVLQEKLRTSEIDIEEYEKYNAIISRPDIYTQKLLLLNNKISRLKEDMQKEKIRKKSSPQMILIFIMILIFSLLVVFNFSAITGFFTYQDSELHVFDVNMSFSQNANLQVNFSNVISLRVDAIISNFTNSSNISIIVRTDNRDYILLDRAFVDDLLPENKQGVTNLITGFATFNSSDSDNVTSEEISEEIDDIINDSVTDSEEIIIQESSFFNLSINESQNNDSINNILLSNDVANAELNDSLVSNTNYSNSSSNLNASINQSLNFSDNLSMNVSDVNASFNLSTNTSINTSNNTSIVDINMSISNISIDDDVNLSVNISDVNLSLTNITESNFSVNQSINLSIVNISDNLSAIVNVTDLNLSVSNASKSFILDLSDECGETCVLDCCCCCCCCLSPQIQCTTFLI